MDWGGSGRPHDVSRELLTRDTFIPRPQGLREHPRQRHLNQLRNALREFYPGALEAFGTDLASADALAVVAVDRYLNPVGADRPARSMDLAARAGPHTQADGSATCRLLLPERL